MFRTQRSDALACGKESVCDMRVTGRSAATVCVICPLPPTPLMHVSDRGRLRVFMQHGYKGHAARPPHTGCAWTDVAQTHLHLARLARHSPHPSSLDPSVSSFMQTLQRCRAVTCPSAQGPQRLLQAQVLHCRSLPRSMSSGPEGPTAVSESDWQRNLVTDTQEVLDLARRFRSVAVLGIKTERQADQPAFYVARYLQDAGVDVRCGPGLWQPLWDAKALS